jgi:hypothetical protein
METGGDDEFIGMGGNPGDIPADGHGHEDGGSGLPGGAEAPLEPDQLADTGILREQEDVQPRHLVDAMEGMVDDIMAACYAENSELAAVAAGRGMFLADKVFMVRGQKPDEQPCAERLQNALTRILFVFTNPEDHDDTLDSRMMYREIAQLEGLIAMRTGERVTAEDLTAAIDQLSLQMTLLQAQMESVGELAGFAAEDRYALVKMRLDTLMR